MSEEKEIKIEAGLGSISKMILGFVPGGHLWTEVVEFNGKLRQERLNRFSKLVIAYFEEHSDLEFDYQSVDKELFNDAFISIVKKVIATGQEEKLKRLRNVLVRQIIEPDDSDLFLKFIEYIDQINEVQVRILDEIYKLCYYQPDGRPQFGELFNSGSRVRNTSIGDEVYRLTIHSDKFGITDTQLSFYLSDLKAKDFIKVYTPEGVNRHVTNNANPLNETHEITVVGMEFIHFVSEYGSE